MLLNVEVESRGWSVGFQALGAEYALRTNKSRGSRGWVELRLSLSKSNHNVALSTIMGFLSSPYPL